jgi:hypothetical protein
MPLMLELKRAVPLVIVLSAFAFGLCKAWQQPVPSFGFRMPVIDPPVVQAEAEKKPPVRKRGRHRFRRDEEPDVITGRLDSHFVSSRLHVQTHASSLVELKDGCTSDTLLAQPAACGRRCSAATPALEGSAPPCRDRIRAFWFSGSREGASDVTVNTSVFDPARNEWSAERVVASRSSTQRALHRYVAKLGNPVAARAG